MSNVCPGSATLRILDVKEKRISLNALAMHLFVCFAFKYLKI